MPTPRVLSPRVLRRSLVAVAVLAMVVLVVVLATGVALVRRPFPAHEGRIALPGLGGEVSIRRDARGVPQIYAGSSEDLFRAQGYVHAQDRFFEMDWRRHVTAGRLAELVGDDPKAARADRVVRTLGWRQVAQAEFEQADPSTRQYLEAYARGVNDYLGGRSASRLSLNYPLLGLAHPRPVIEPWTPVDSLAWFKALAWDLRGNDTAEVDRALAYGVVRDVARVDQLYPAYPYDRHAPIVSSPVAGTGPRSAPSAAGAGFRTRVSLAGLMPGPASDALAAAREALAAVPTGVTAGDGIGSNSWVVSGALTASGKPLLANDPHLAPALPGVWYQVGLHCRTVLPSCPFDVSGFSFAGVPGVFIGHNGRIAWGLTNLGPDVTDLYLEKVSGDQVERDGKLVPLTIRTETLAIAGGQRQTVRIRTGPHGPLLSDVLPDLVTVGRRAPAADVARPSQGYAVALAWTALTPGHDMDAVFGMNLARDFTSFREAALRMNAPAQNLVYADVDGHIGYQAPGRIPMRTSSPPPAPPAPPLSAGSRAAAGAIPDDGTWPLPGWTSRYDWRGYADPADLPWALDPAEGFVVAANQAVTPPGGPVRLAPTFDYGYRSQRIRDLLTQKISSRTKLTVADLEALQADTRSGLAAELIPLLRGVKISDPFYAEALQLLDGWTGDQPVDSAAAAFFNAVWASLLDLTFNDELPEGSRPDGGGRWFEVVRILLSDPNDAWWDDRGTPSVLETRDEIIRQSIIQARNRLTRSIGKDPTTWTWGRLHRLSLVQTPLGRSDWTAGIHWLLNEGPEEMPGGTAVVNAFGWNAASGDFRVVWAPSMRMVVDLGTLDGSRWVNQTGQTGHPGHDHYLDQLQAWKDGRTFPWPFSPEAVRTATRHTLVLTPTP